MLVQVAFDDIVSLNSFKLSEHFDSAKLRFEFGTPIVNEFGFRQLADNYGHIPAHQIYVDTKTIDFHINEILSLKSCNLRKCSFLIGSEHKSLLNVSQHAAFSDFEIWISTMGAPLSSLKEACAPLLDFGYRYFIAHGHGVSLTDAFDDMLSRFEVLNSLPGVEIVLAGGIRLSDIKMINEISPYAVIIGRTITSSDSPQFVLRQFLEQLK